MRSFKLHRKIKIYLPEFRQTIYTERYPYVYLSENGVFFSNLKTMDPIMAFESSVPRMYFQSDSNASLAFNNISKAAKEGYNRLLIEERGVYDLSVRASK